MQKIISLFQRNYDGDKLVRDEVVPGAEWVVEGQGRATRKFDGTCCLIEDGILYKRYDAKQGKTPPDGFVPAQEPDAKTGHWPGWLPVGGGPDDQYHRAGQWFQFPESEGGLDKAPDGTYELVGPKVQGNPEGFAAHQLIKHGVQGVPDFPRDFEGIKARLSEGDIEGVVWHHPDGRMVKVKAKDFGITRGAPRKSGV